MGTPLHIWVDADACPGVIKEILYRAANRLKVQLTLVANQPLQVPRSAYINTVRVGAGFDVADNEIAERVRPGDLVITADIPLAAAVIERHAHALNPRGEMYTKESIGQRLSMRNFMDELRGSGVMTGGPPPFGQQERKAFADTLDRFLHRHLASG